MSRNKADQKHIRDLLKEKDAFLTTSERLMEFSLRHTRALIGAAVAVALVGLAVYGFVHSRRAAELEAAASLEQALNVAGAGPAIEALEKVRAEHAGREAARLAVLSLIGLYTETGAPEKALPLAEDMLQTLRPKEQSLRPVLLDSLGGLYESLKDYPRARQNYQALLDWPPLDDNFKQGVLLALARVQAAAGAREEAVRIYESFLRDYPGSFRANLARTGLAALRLKPE